MSPGDSRSHRRVAAATTPRLRDRLAGAPDGRLELLHRGPHAVYLLLDDGHETSALGVLAAGAVRVPNGLRTALPRLDALDLSDQRLVEGSIRLGAEALVVTRLVDATVPRLRDAGRVRAARPGDAASVLDGIGRGDGLTPYGDDVACGWLAARVASGLPVPADEVRTAARRTTLLSATLLDCALHGEVLPEFATWLHSRSADDEAALLSVGASSGRGLLQGARVALGDEAVAA
jgi:hypothetical protein